MVPVVHQSTFINILQSLEAWLKSSALAEARMASGSKISPPGKRESNGIEGGSITVDSGDPMPAAGKLL